MHISIAVAQIAGSDTIFRLTLLLRTIQSTPYAVLIG